MAHKLLSSLHSTLMYLKPLLVPIRLLTINKEIILYLQSFYPKCKVSKSRKTGSFWSSDMGSLNTWAKESVAESTHPSQIYKLLSELYEETWVTWKKTRIPLQKKSTLSFFLCEFCLSGKGQLFYFCFWIRSCFVAKAGLETKTVLLPQPTPSSRIEGLLYHIQSISLIILR